MPEPLKDAIDELEHALALLKKAGVENSDIREAECDLARAQELLNRIRL